MIRQGLWVGLMVALLGLLPAACNSDGAAAVKAYEGLADAVCACKDLECATKAGQAAEIELTKYKKAKLDESQKQATMKAGERAAECVKKFAPEMAPAPTPAPAPAPGTEAAPAPPTPAPATP